MTDAAHLAYDDSGAGPALVFLHGLTFSRHTWDPIIDRLRGDHRCVSIDLPGHGDSPGSAADPWQAAERLHRTLNAIGVDAPVVIGHSAGALMATGYASTYSTVGVVNIDQPLLVAPFAELVQRLSDQLRGPDFDSAFAPFEESIGVARLPEPERSRVAGTRRIDQATVLDHWSLPLGTPPEELQPKLDAMIDSVTVPYLYLAGDKPADPVRQHLQAHLKGLELVVWAGTGHLAHLVDPDRFAELVADFAARVC
jgi:pimeloyl-ACP methyl ester carboxylesterase